jgi:type IV pilus assembly protein PilX
MHASRNGQRGAALVVGLLLLTILTLLAIAGMNTASTELVMAGNEQFREGAFHAAEAGIEREIVHLTDVAPDSADITRTADYGRGNTSETTISYRGQGEVKESSTGSYAAFHYDVISVGRSARNATSTHTQGAYYANRVGPAVDERPSPGGSPFLTPP